MKSMLMNARTSGAGLKDLDFSLPSQVNIFGAFFKPYRGIKDVASTLLATISAPFLLAATTAIATAICAVFLALLPIRLTVHGLMFFFSSGREAKQGEVAAAKKDVLDMAGGLLFTLECAIMTVLSIPFTLLRIPSRAIATVADCLNSESEELAHNSFAK